MRQVACALSLGALAAVACGRGESEPDATDGSATAQRAPSAATVVMPVDSGFASVPDSAWVTLAGPTIVAFHPVVSNDSLAADEGLAGALDDLSYHLGTAMDSLAAAGMAVRYDGGDTIWLRGGAHRLRFVRPADSASVGYVFADTLGRWTAIYGVRSYVDLVANAHEFIRTGTLSPDVR